MTSLTIQTADPVLPRQRRGPAPGENTPPRLTTTVPRQYVHRASHAEVFLTSGERLDDTHFHLTAQWPRTHTFFTTNNTHHDPLQAAETIRQTGLYLAHTQFNVPLDHHFLLWELNITTHPHPTPTHTTPHHHPTELTLHATTPHTTRKGNRLTQFTMTVDIHQNHHLTATGSGRFTCISPNTYKRLRPHTTPPPTTRPTHHLIPPTHTGRTHPTDTVLTTTPHPHTYLLTPDPHHPILFEHTTDHYPGMVLLEAAQQATTHHTTTNTGNNSNSSNTNTNNSSNSSNDNSGNSNTNGGNGNGSSGPHTTTLNTTFHHYAEYHTPLHIHITPHPTTPNHTTTHTITGTQNNTTIFTTTHTHTTTPTQPTT
ncbi:hypothetical protein SAM40697_0201 [Streptomyces ambofaciens]|uniref:A-factor biosynthesis hotdog domain-containing protein n=1 Tax=Streptomyces ambofaciens TaxID=1889 RepID=A0ABN4P1A9_STRAM|nr:ScbA/BarX family gamma-butyrolactone biosynthesis protein [Streptomyces ambofaciens]ANB04164.1 hypothetical protein SAM40697_0201 [Streptomyces ambofaciens]